MKSALVVVDVQQFFINEFTKDIPIRIKQFIDQHKFDFVLFFKFVNEPGSNWDKAGWKKMMTDAEIAIVPELRSYSNDQNTFSKTAFSVFASKEFRNLMKVRKVTDLYICGLDTHACIYASALEAYSRGYRVHVLEDLCAASHGNQYHAQAIDMLKKNLGPAVVMESSQYSG